MEQMARRKLPASMVYEWTGMSFQEKRVGSQSIFIFALAVLMVYLVLAAQYESWTMPAAVILVVPLALLGTVAAVSFRGMDNNVYTQIGVVLIIALASKNAILIVEFAHNLRTMGRPILEAAVEASRLRFRPILMTSFAFILGIWPLVNASGAGAAESPGAGNGRLRRHDRLHGPGGLLRPGLLRRDPTPERAPTPVARCTVRRPDGPRRVQWRAGTLIGDTPHRR